LHHRVKDAIIALSSWDKVMNIRPAAQSDVENIGSIHVESWQETYRGLIPDAVLDSVTVGARVAMWRNTIEHHSATTPIFVAEVAGGDIVGFAAGGPSVRPLGAIWWTISSIWPKAPDWI
jgi:L-amino acid N-acyltransferase YncA